MRAWLCKLGTRKHVPRRARGACILRAMLQVRSRDTRSRLGFVCMCPSRSLSRSVCVCVRLVCVCVSARVGVGGSVGEHARGYAALLVSAIRSAGESWERATEGKRTYPSTPTGKDCLQRTRGHLRVCLRAGRLLVGWECRKCFVAFRHEPGPRRKMSLGKRAPQHGRGVSPTRGPPLCA